METASQNITDVKAVSEHEPAATEADRTKQDARSDYGAVPGAEFPVSVYVSVFVAFAWIIVASWLAFANGGDAVLALAIAGVLTIVFFALPLLVWLTARSRSDASRDAPGDFLGSHVETATGPLTGASVWLQILLIPASLALAATLIGVTSILVH